MSKKTILFVVGTLYRAGAERFVYEIDSALDKSKFTSSILCLEMKEDISTNWNERYYEKKHEALGTTITFLDSFIDKKPSSFLIVRFFHKVTLSKFKQNKKNRLKLKFYSYLNQFDLIHWIGEYTFIHSVPLYIKEKSLISSMSAKFQNANLYKAYDFSYPYNFISGFRLEDGEYEEFENINHTFFPLVMAIHHKTNHWRFQDNEIKKIGIFTRLNKNKPLDPFFYAFQLLLDQIPNCELHIYGNGNPVTEGMIEYLDRLAITDKVFFRGHQEDIVQTMTNEHLDICWFQGYNNNVPAGYAGFDICTTGTPLVCWDFHVKPFNSFSSIYPHFKNLNNFVNYSLEILSSRKKAETLSIAQFTDVIKTRNIDDFISDLEDLYSNFPNTN